MRLCLSGAAALDPNVSRTLRIRLLQPNGKRVKGVDLMSDSKDSRLSSTSYPIGTGNQEYYVDGGRRSDPGRGCQSPLL